jgi:hypothetical protein
MIMVIVVIIRTDCTFGRQEIETQVGPFNLAGPPLTETKLISEFGEGFVKSETIGEKIISKKHIYWVPGQEVWVQASLSHVLSERMERIVEAVLVTRKKLCEQKYVPKAPLGLLATSKGIKINDSMDKVIKEYGRPNISKVIGKDKIFTVLDEELALKEGIVIRYLQKQPARELNFAEFYFSQDKLHSFLISESE